MERRLAAIMAADMAGYSRLMEHDESGVIARQKAHRRELIDPEIVRHRGHIVKTTGDGLLAEFASAYDAVRCALEMQAAMPGREDGRAEDERIRYRVGINVGDVVFDDGDIFGDCVNVAARLEGLAEPGGVCVSSPVYQMVQERLSEPFRNLGAQRVKNIARPIQVWQWTPHLPAEDIEISPAARNQSIQFCTAPDGVQIAYASVGSGPPLFKAPNWMSHLEHEWRSPVFAPLLAGFAERHRLVRFDQRGNGLSDWHVDAISEDAMVADMAAVVEAAGLERFALLGISQGCAFSIRYAVEHPEKVRCLVLHGGYALGRFRSGLPEKIQLQTVSEAMILQGWGSPNPSFRRFFTSNFIPDATPEQSRSFDELQRVSATPEMAVRISRMNAEIDVRDLARRIAVPTLVLHTRGDQRIPFEDGRALATLIPHARFVPLEGNDHIPLEGSAAFDDLLRETNAFLAEVGEG